MRIAKIAAKNFRLLKDVTLTLDKTTTVIVGRNNSGKTSLTELFRRLLSEKPSFRLEDFSLSVHERFWEAFQIKTQAAGDDAIDKIRETLPYIEVALTVEYKDTEHLASLSDFIVDLNQDCTEALILMRYRVMDGKVDALFDGLDVDVDKRKFFRAIGDRICANCETSVFAVDPNDPENRRKMEIKDLRTLLRGGFITAQRGMDDVTHKDVDVLGKILWSLSKISASDSAYDKDRAIVRELEHAVEQIEGSIRKDFKQQLDGLLPVISVFGYPGLNDPKMETETTLDVDRLLKDHTRICYPGIQEGTLLPENYNGLGARNLVYILFRFYEFFKQFMAEQPRPGLHLVFIEEPEVHLHPQMQEVFINHISKIPTIFSKDHGAEPPWTVQLVVTTHSSHLANRARFDSMRYFQTGGDTDAPASRATEIKDIANAFGDTPREQIEFLHKYMTLTRCDLLFADKAILIEGATERLLLPEMIKKIAETGGSDSNLSTQRQSVVEVGGAYAHYFFNFLEFLGLRTLIIIDIYSVDNSTKHKACKVSEGTSTSNACIKKWFENEEPTPKALLAKKEDDKTRSVLRLAYQIPENDYGPCGRSFEDAFILANGSLFDLSQPDEDSAWNEAQGIKKTDFALKYALKSTDWRVPRYIAEAGVLI